MATEDDLQNMSPEEIAKAQKENCIFCKIIRGDIPSRKVYEDEKMLAILDINPATKGHTLVMPKEHYPILPVVPPDVFKHLFKTTKYLASAIKKGMVAEEITVFVANGAVAGQQSPHFLFHIIPKDEGTDFSLPKGKVLPEEAAKITPALRANIAQVMKAYLQREGKYKGEALKQPIPAVPPPAPQGGPDPMQALEEEKTQPAPEESRANLATIIMQNPQLKDLIINNPARLKELIKTNRQLAALFAGVNIERLSQKLSEFERKKDDGKGKGTPQHDGGHDERGDEGDDGESSGGTDLDKISRLFT